MCRKTDYFKHIIHKNQNCAAAKPQVIGGLSCLEYDRLFTLPVGEQELKPGDNIIYERVGAYTMTLTPLFIHYLPAVYVYDGNEFQIIRNEWTENEFIAQSEY